MSRQWKHKLCDFYIFWQNTNVGNKSWNTGQFKRKLETVAYSKHKKYAFTDEARAQAIYVLEKRNLASGRNRVSQLKSLLSFCRFN